MHINIALNENNPKTISTTTFNSGDVIIFNYNDAKMESNDYVYSLFNTMLTEILNQRNTFLFNLIGHSRGGIVNGMYAIANPSHIKGLYSIGTPYFENDLAQMVQFVNYIADDTDIEFFDDLASGLLKNSEAYMDLANSTLARNLRTGINQVYNNYDFNFATFGNDVNIIKPFYIDFKLFNIRIDVEFNVKNDGLVNAFDAIGIKSNIVNKTLFGLFEHYYINSYFNFSNNLLNPNKIIYTYQSWELLQLQIQLLLGNDLDKLTHPGTLVAVPHNLQTMQPEFHDYILTNI